MKNSIDYPLFDNLLSEKQLQDIFNSFQDVLIANVKDIQIPGFGELDIDRLFQLIQAEEWSPSKEKLTAKNPKENIYQNDVWDFTTKGGKAIVNREKLRNLMDRWLIGLFAEQTLINRRTFVRKNPDYKAFWDTHLTKEERTEEGVEKDIKRLKIIYDRLTKEWKNPSKTELEIQNLEIRLEMYRYRKDKAEQLRLEEEILGLYADQLYDAIQQRREEQKEWIKAIEEKHQEAMKNLKNELNNSSTSVSDATLGKKVASIIGSTGKEAKKLASIREDFIDDFAEKALKRIESINFDTIFEAMERSKTEAIEKMQGHIKAKEDTIKEEQRIQQRKKDKQSNRQKKKEARKKQKEEQEELLRKQEQTTQIIKYIKISIATILLSGGIVLGYKTYSESDTQKNILKTAKEKNIPRPPKQSIPRIENSNKIPQQVVTIQRIGFFTEKSANILLKEIENNFHQLSLRKLQNSKTKEEIWEILSKNKEAIINRLSPVKNHDELLLNSVKLAQFLAEKTGYKLQDIMGSVLRILARLNKFSIRGIKYEYNQGHMSKIIILGPSNNTLAELSLPISK